MNKKDKRTKLKSNRMTQGDQKGCFRRKAHDGVLEEDRLLHGQSYTKERKTPGFRTAGRGKENKQRERQPAPTCIIGRKPQTG